MTEIIMPEIGDDVHALCAAAICNSECDNCALNSATNFKKYQAQQKACKEPKDD